MAAPRHLCSILIGGLLLVAGLSPLPTAAQVSTADSIVVDTSRAQWHTTLPQVTVSASRLPTSPSQAPARVTVLDSSALQTTGASSVASLLDTRGDLHVRQYGDGGLATPALRATGASQTALLLDGQRITNPQLGHLDLSLLPTALLHSVEVMHGPASPVHGSDGLGGAIHLHSLAPQSSLQARATGYAGAFGARGGSLLLGGAPANQTSVLAMANVQATEGDFPYTDESLFPPETTRRQNADRVRRTMYGTVRSRVADHQLQISGWWTRAERGLPGPGSSSSQERQWDTQLRIWGRDTMPMGEGSLTVKGMTQHTRLRYVNPAQNLDQTGRTWGASLETTLQTPMSPRWTVAGGLEGSHDRARHPNLADAAHQEHLAAFAEGTGRYGRFRLYPALRTDTYWMPRGSTRLAASPRLGINLQPRSAWPDLYVKVQIGRSFRVPTFNDRYWQPGGDPSLQPERSWGGDVGLRLDRARGHAEVTAFGHWRRDQIVWQPSGDGYWQPQNVGRVRALGVEASADRTWRLAPGSHLETGLSYTITDARDRSEPGTASYDEPLRYVPRDQLKTHATVTVGPAALDVNARYTGRRYVTSDGSQFLDAYLLVDTQLRLEHTFGDVQTELSVQLDNVFDVDYRTLGNRPMPPRNARVRLLVAL